MKIVAHRGVCTEALENSWDAFHKAVEVGADRIELDVHLSADGHLVIVHDEDLERIAGMKVFVADLTRKELLDTVKLSNGEKLPFLDEVFARYRSGAHRRAFPKNDQPRNDSRKVEFCVSTEAVV